ncbi:MAG: ATP-binding protein [Burkholderiaceae bacterium]
MKIPLFQRLSLRIWLAVVATIAVLAVLAGWLSRLDAERERAMRPGREIVLLDAFGNILGQAPARPVRAPGQAPEFQVKMQDGSTLYIQLPRPREAGAPRGPMGRNSGRDSPALGFAWMLAFIAFAVALGTYPIVRRLTKRLEGLEQGVRQWGDGDLTVRLPQAGNDEVAHLAEGFNRAAERVQALLLSHKALLANASHELRSPLTRIRMGLELMGPQASSEFRDEIARNIQELDQLIDEILLASRLDASEVDIGTMEPVDLLGMSAEECARLDAQLQVDGEAAELEVMGIAKLLRRVVRNLLENARRHAAGAVTMHLGAVGKQIEIQVCDQGPGVPVALRERIFEPFYRLPGASERDGGVGLGLALVKSIVLRHGGTVRCDNHAGGGACFRVSLPQLGRQ